MPGNSGSVSVTLFTTDFYKELANLQAHLAHLQAKKEEQKKQALQLLIFQLLKEAEKEAKKTKFVNECLNI